MKSKDANMCIEEILPRDFNASEYFAHSYIRGISPLTNTFIMNVLWNVRKTF